MAQAASRLTIAVSLFFFLDLWWTVWQVFLQVLRFFFASIIPSVLHTYLHICILYSYQKDEREKPKNVTEKYFRLLFILIRMKRGHCLGSSEQSNFLSCPPFLYCASLLHVLSLLSIVPVHLSHHYQCTVLLCSYSVKLRVYYCAFCSLTLRITWILCEVSVRTAQ
jgi:hypothetical protein